MSIDYGDSLKDKSNTIYDKENKGNTKKKIRYPFVFKF
jgi:hypothetical protein